MPGTPTTKWAIPTLDGSVDLVNAGPSEINAAFAAIDALLTPHTEGTLTAKPVSTGGSPGRAGRTYYATDAKITYRDNGTGWDPVMPRTFGVLAPSADYTLTGAYGDVPGVTLSITPLVASALLIVGHVGFNLGILATGVINALAAITVDGAAEAAPFAQLNASQTPGFRAQGAIANAIALSAAAHTIKLRAIATGLDADHSGVVQKDMTRLLYLLLPT